MKPQTLQTPRNVITGIMMAVGIGLFVLVAVKAIHQVSDRQYVVGKQHTVSGEFHSKAPEAVISSINNYESKLGLKLGSPVNSQTDKASKDKTDTTPATTQSKETSKVIKQADNSQSKDKNTASSGSEESSINDDLSATLENPSSTTSKDVNNL